MILRFSRTTIPACSMSPKGCPSSSWRPARTRKPSPSRSACSEESIRSSSLQSASNRNPKSSCSPSSQSGGKSDHHFAWGKIANQEGGHFRCPMCDVETLEGWRSYQLCIESRVKSFSELLGKGFYGIKGMQMCYKKKKRRKKKSFLPKPCVRRSRATPRG